MKNEDSETVERFSEKLAGFRKNFSEFPEIFRNVSEISETFPKLSKLWR